MAFKCVCFFSPFFFIWCSLVSSSLLYFLNNSIGDLKRHISSGERLTEDTRRNRFISYSNTLTLSSRWRRNLKLAECGNLKSKEERTEKKNFTDGAKEFSKCQCLALRNRDQLRAQLLLQDVVWGTKIEIKRERESHTDKESAKKKLDYLNYRPTIINHY